MKEKSQAGRLACFVILATIAVALPLAGQEAPNNPAKSGVISPFEILPHGDGQTCPLAGRTIVNANMAWDLVDLRYNNAPKAGQAAPPLQLRVLGEDKTLKLSELRAEKPVVLLFSSYGCDVFRETLGGLHRVYEEFKDDVHFVFVYIREAHALDGNFAFELARIEDPKTDAERHAAAKLCRDRLDLPFPTVLVDGVDDRAAIRWAAWPTRAYVVDTAGKVVYAGAQGPWGYKPFKGYEHHVFDRIGADPAFNQNSLEDFLERVFRPDS